MNLPVHHLSIKIYEDSLDNNHEHEDDHESVVSLYGYVTGMSDFIEIESRYLYTRRTDLEYLITQNLIILQDGG